VINLLTTHLSQSVYGQLIYINISGGLLAGDLVEFNVTGVTNRATAVTKLS